MLLLLYVSQYGIVTVVGRCRVTISLNFRKFKVVLNTLYKFIKRCQKLHNTQLMKNLMIKNSVTAWFSIYKYLKLKLSVSLAGDTVVTVVYCVTKMIPMCSPMIGQSFIRRLYHQQINSGYNDAPKCWKLFWATLRQKRLLRETFRCIRIVPDEWGISGQKPDNICNMTRQIDRKFNDLVVAAGIDSLELWSPAYGSFCALISSQT